MWSRIVGHTAKTKYKIDVVGIVGQVVWQRRVNLKMRWYSDDA